MKKKGMVLSQLILMLVTIVGVILLLSLYYIGPDALLQKATDAIPSVFSFLPRNGQDEPTTSTGARGTSDQAIKVLEDFVITYSHLAKDPATTCFAYIDKSQFEGFFDKFILEIAKNPTGSSINLLIKINNEGDYNARKEIFSREIEGVEPCVVYGTSANSFYDNWLKNDAIGTNSFDGQKVDKITLADNKIEFGVITEDWETSDSNSDYALYKNGDTICLFPVKLKLLSVENCKINDGAIRTNCFNELPNGADALSPLHNSFYNMPSIVSHTWDETSGRCLGT